MADVILLLRRAPWATDVMLTNGVMAGGIFDAVDLVSSSGEILADSSVRDPGSSPFTAEERAVATAGREWTSPVTFDALGLPALTFVVPAGRDGALLAKLPLERMWRLVDEIDAGPGGFAFVVSVDGSLIASPDKAAILKGTRPKLPPVYVRPDILLVSSPVSGLGWTVYIEQPLSRALFPAWLVLRRSLYLVLVALALSLGLGVTAARLYARSLDALLRGTARIAEGDLESRIPAEGKDEFGVLSRSFNDMVARLAERTSALEASEVRYRRVTENVSDIIYALDREGRFAFVNSSVRRILGMSPEEMIGRPITDFLVPWERQRKLAQLQREMFTPGRQGGSGDARALTRGGRSVILEYENAVAIGPSGEPLIHGIARDVTQRRALEEKLRRSEKLAALGEIVSRVAHELRNAVAGIAASMTLARTGGVGEGGVEKELDRSLSEVTRAQGIVEGLLGTTPSRAERERCSLNEALDAVLDARRAAIEAAGISLVRQLAPAAPPVMANGDLLRQVFHNIVDNAQRALTPGGKTLPGAAIRARTWVRDQRVYAEIADTGPGIGEEHLAHVFDPFYTTRAGSGGTGLGLAVSLGIVEEFGGDITAHSAPGEGAAFTVVLPATAAAVPPDRDPAGRHVLVVEDEPALREFIHQYVESMGCVVDGAANGREAVSTLASGASCDLVISDVSMPDRDGQDLYEWIRTRRPALLSRLIFVTGDSMNGETRAFLERTGVPYLLKPVVAAVLESEVRRCLAEAAR
jgi:two-component system NtrC family sensor kinase